MISRRQAMQFHIVPLRWEEGQLEIATTHKSLERAAGFCMQSLTTACRMVLVDELTLVGLIERFYPPV
jgi:hypothetical protein